LKRELIITGSTCRKKTEARENLTALKLTTIIRIQNKVDSFSAH
jgi:hypothetical protein